MAETHQKLHAIMISFPFQGHINPFVNLAINLASKGFAITFVHTEHTHHQITKAQSLNSTIEPDIFAESRKSGLDISYTTISDGHSLEVDRSLKNEEYWDYFIDVFPTHVDEFVGKLVKSNPSLAHLLITDTFYYWPATIAEKHNLVNVSFWTQPALAFTLNYHIDLLIKNGHFAAKDNRKDTIDYIPGIQAIEPQDLTSFLQETNITTIIHRIAFKAFDAVKKSDIVIGNMVQELEPETIETINQKLPTYAIGPILPPGFAKSSVAMSLWSESGCTQWLNTKPHGSVLYVSFGSIAVTSEHDIIEIAHGILRSKVNFIWVVRPGSIDSNDANMLPIGLENALKDQGLIVPWCHQIEVLSHPAIGGFLTHCGWNSLLESIWCGIPLICFPFSFDQIPNRKLVVDDWKIGINLFDGKLITREEVTTKISRLMSENTSYELRKEIKKVKKILENALAIDGSSTKNTDKFIEDLKDRIRKKNELTVSHKFIVNHCN